jgi:hypothetical protein
LRIPIFAVATAEIKPSTDPLIGAVLDVWELALAVIAIKPPSQGKLAMIVQAQDPLGLGFGLTQRR